MGCDIWMRAEIRRDGGWSPAPPVFVDERDPRKPYGHRNYSLFAILANVRNGYGFAGVVTGEGFNPIAPLRGVPDDACDETAEYVGRDFLHSTTWYTLAEMEAYDWDQTTTRCGVIPGEAYERLAPGAEPSSWCGFISGAGIEIFTPESYAEWKAAGGREVTRPYVRVWWPTTYRNAVGDEWFEAMALLRTLIPKGGSAADVRVVMGFDS